MNHSSLPSSLEEPFIAEVIHGWDRSSRPVPSARIVVGSGLPSLIADLGPSDVGYLALLMPFVTANGDVGPSAATVSAALGGLRPTLRLRLLRLARRYWRGQPVLYVRRTASGLETFHPAKLVLGRREFFPPPETPHGVSPAAGSRAIIDASRAAYARPKAEVEKELTIINGWPARDELDALAQAAAQPPGSLDERWAVERLAKESVDYSLAVKLVREYGAERCLRQLRALPGRRGIRDKKRYIVGAIMRDYPLPEVD